MTCCCLISKAVWVSQGLSREPGTCWVQAFLVVLSFPGWHMRAPKVDAAISVPSSDMALWGCVWMGYCPRCVGCDPSEAQVISGGMLGMQVLCLWDEVALMFSLQLTMASLFYLCMPVYLLSLLFVLFPADVHVFCSVCLSMAETAASGRTSHLASST